MIRSKYTGPVCALIVTAALIFTILFSFTDLLGIRAADAQMGYEALLFDDTQVHTIDIVADEGDWADMIANAAAEEYISCTVVIDGEKVGNAAIRAKGNTSLSSVQGMNSQRYSFKVEFDHFVSGRTYHGLDKLSLNNLIYDATYMKDYLVYDMMRYIGAKAPLSSFAAITVNGEAWGLYLAVEAVEDAFLTRNYGTDHGELYKPDNMGMQGGGQKRGDMPEQGTMPEGFTPATPGNAAERTWGGGEGRPALPESFDPADMEAAHPLLWPKALAQAKAEAGGAWGAAT